MLEIPVKDSPITPKTTKSPKDISQSAGGPSLLPPSTSQGAELKSSGWRIKVNHGPHRDVLAFKPSSKAEAIAFLSQASIQLPSRVKKVSADTPRSSRTDKWQGRPDKMLCHGCHGHMGGGAHNGSAPGKNNCTLEHNLTCPGGFVEKEDWKPCPANYVFQAQGFDNTMSSQDFRPQYQVQPDGTTSTPSLAGHSTPLS